MDRYSVAGRYMDGTRVLAYHVVNNDTGKAKKLTKIQLCYFIGKGEIVNCTCSVYGDDMLIRGKGIKLDDLPVINEGKGVVKAGKKPDCGLPVSTATHINKSEITAVYEKDGEVTGYEVTASSIKRNINRDTLLKLIVDNKISNAKVGLKGGKTVIDISNTSNVRKVNISNNKGKPNITKDKFIIVEDAEYILYAAMSSNPMHIENAITHEVFDTNPVSDIILRGASGEMWVADLNDINRKYCQVDGSEITKDTFNKGSICIKLKEKKRYKALLIPMPNKVNVGNRITNMESIEHGKGDYVIYNGKTNRADGTKNIEIVNGKMFDRLYKVI